MERPTPLGAVKRRSPILPGDASYGLEDSFGSQSHPLPPGRETGSRTGGIAECRILRSSSPRVGFARRFGGSRFLYHRSRIAYGASIVPASAGDRREPFAGDR